MINYKKEFISKLKLIARQGFTEKEVFEGFVSCATIAIVNTVDLHNFKRREAKYFDILKKYGSDNILIFKEMLEITTNALNTEISDFLGDVYMSLDFGSKNLGQHFTPYAVSYLVASCSVDLYTIADNEITTINDPCIGAGSMCLAICDLLNSKKEFASEFNYKDKIHFTGVDIDYIAICMAYVQLSVLSIPAILVHGNSLTVVENEVFYTPEHVIKGWHFKLKKRNDNNSHYRVNIPKEENRQGAFEFKFD